MYLKPLALFLKQVQSLRAFKRDAGPHNNNCEFYVGVPHWQKAR